MRQIKHISPSGLSQFLKNEDEYYLRYLAENKPIRFKQTKPMAAGSAFDRKMKRDMNFEHNGVDPQWEEYAVSIEQRMVDIYKASGAWARFITDVGGLDNVQFESTVIKTVEGIPLLGKPDLYLPDQKIVFDWKVNGFCSKASPKQGYVNCDGKMHKKCVWSPVPYPCNGMPMEDYAPDWAMQLGTYGIMLNADFFIVHQLTGPDCRVSEYAGKISQEYLDGLMANYAKCWEFSHIEQPRLEKIAKMCQDPLFNELTRSNNIW